jgi:hypothetical protein
LTQPKRPYPAEGKKSRAAERFFTPNYPTAPGNHATGIHCGVFWVMATTKNYAYLVTIPRLERDEPYTIQFDAGCSLLEGMADDDNLDYVITLALDDIGQGDPGDNYPDDLDCLRSSVTCRKLTKEEADKSRPDRYIG